MRPSLVKVGVKVRRNSCWVHLFVRVEDLTRSLFSSLLIHNEDPCWDSLFISYLHSIVIEHRLHKLVIGWSLESSWDNSVVIGSWSEITCCNLDILIRTWRWNSWNSWYSWWSWSWRWVRGWANIITRWVRAWGGRRLHMGAWDQSNEGGNCK